MAETQDDKVICPVCGECRPRRSMVSGAQVSDGVHALLRERIAGWQPDEQLCHVCLTQVEMARLLLLLEEGGGTLPEDPSVTHTSTRHVGVEFERHRTPGERVADDVAAFVGSWAFILTQGIFLAIWVLINTVVWVIRPFDPYPFIFLNLVLSWIAALQAPLILMSQNRQDMRDRLRDDLDYQTNLQAEQEVRRLTARVDALLRHWRVPPPEQ